MTHNNKLKKYNRILDSIKLNQKKKETSGNNKNPVILPFFVLLGNHNFVFTSSVEAMLVKSYLVNRIQNDRP